MDHFISFDIYILIIISTFLIINKQIENFTNQSTYQHHKPHFSKQEAVSLANSNPEMR